MVKTRRGRLEDAVRAAVQGGRRPSGEGVGVDSDSASYGCLKNLLQIVMAFDNPHPGHHGLPNKLLS